MNPRRRLSRSDVRRMLRADVSAGVTPPEGEVRRLAALAATSPTPARGGWLPVRTAAGTAGAVGIALLGGLGVSYAAGVVQPPWAPPAEQHTPSQVPESVPASPDAPSNGDAPTRSPGTTPPAPGQADNPGRSRPTDRTRGANESPGSGNLGRGPSGAPGSGSTNGFGPQSNPGTANQGPDANQSSGRVEPPGELRRTIGTASRHAAKIPRPRL